jgi:hypothetical protein
MTRTLFTLEVTIIDGLMTEAFAKANPVISRTIEIRADQTLNQLHRAIFETFDRWDDCHLCEFHLGREPRHRYGVPGVWLPVWLDELQGRRNDEAETILSVEAV